MHCFEGHHVTTLGEITSKEGSRHEIQELDSINRLVQVDYLFLTILRLVQVEYLILIIFTYFLYKNHEIRQALLQLVFLQF